jgi:flagellar basal body-associated protein FliL
MTDPHLTEPRRDVGSGAKRALPIIPIALVLIVVAAAAVFAWSHLFAKGAAPQRDASQAEVATGQTEPGRGPYTASDFTEPKSK